MKTSFAIVDAQSVKNTDTAENKGYDAGKKVSGIKRHIAVDTQGLPHAIHITTANVTDRDGAEAMIINDKKNLSDVKTSSVEKFGTFYRQLFLESIYLAPSQFESNFVSSCHGPVELQKLMTALNQGLKTS